MVHTNYLSNHFQSSIFENTLKDIYYNDSEIIKYQKSRYTDAVKEYEKYFGEGEVEVYSAPGRTEVCGNHTDHQNGQVLAASVNLDAIAIVGINYKNCINIVSKGYSPFFIPLDSFGATPEEEGTTIALVKGILSEFKKHGYKIGSFNAYITSDVLNGAGLSSSAAFETLIGTILSGLYNDMSVSSTDIAKIGQHAENKYFGKPCGLMDQMACATGGFVHIDFKDSSNPIIEKIHFDISDYNYSLCIVDTKGSHADLTNDYAMIPFEMKQIAHLFGKSFLRDVAPDDFYKNLSDAAEKVNSRCLLRAMHFFTENERVQTAASALKENNFTAFLNCIEKSGNSSFKYLQNIYADKDPLNQPVSLALAFSEKLLAGHGVCRVHGGGFAGTIQAFVENNYVFKYKGAVEKIFGKDSCHVLQIRKYGGIKVK